MAVLYIQGTKYPKDTEVEHNGVVYIAKKTTTTIPKDGPNWRVVGRVETAGLQGEIDTLKKQITENQAADTLEDAAYETKIKELTAKLATEEQESSYYEAALKREAAEYLTKEQNLRDQLQSKEKELLSAQADDTYTAAAIASLTKDKETISQEYKTALERITYLQKQLDSLKPPVEAPPAKPAPLEPLPDKPIEPTPGTSIALPEPKFTAPPTGYNYVSSVDAPKSINRKVTAGVLPKFSVGHETAGPDGSLVLCGNLKGVKEILVWGKGLTEPVPAKIYFINGERATITLPAALTYETYALWAVNDSGPSNAWVLNAAKIWWAQERIVPGKEASVYGKNLAFNYQNGVDNAYIDLQSIDNGPLLRAKVVEVDPCRIKYIVPTNAVPGKEYKIWAHNGHGGKYGLSNSVSAFCEAETLYNGPVIKPVRLTGETSDSNAWDRATKQANNIKGSVIEVPSAGLVFDRDTVVSGSGYLVKATTTATIKAADTFKGQDFMLALFSPEKVKFQNIKFDGNGKIPRKGMFMRQTRSFVYENCDFYFPECDPLDINDAFNTQIVNCRVTGGITFVGNARQTFIDKSSFTMTRDCNTALHLFAADGFSLTYSTCKDLDPSDVYNGYGWGHGRFWTSNNSWGSARNQYLKGNKGINLGVRMGKDANGNWVTVGTDPNSGEQNLIEGPIGKGAGFALNPTADYKTFGLAFIEDNMGEGVVYIARGTGAGQWQKVKKRLGNTITVDEEWGILPDATSFFIVGHFSYHIALVDIYAGGKPSMSNDPKNVTAQSAVQFYGGAFDCVVIGVTGENLRHGICNLTTNHADAWHDQHPGMEAVGWITYDKCKLINCAYPIRHDLAVPTAGPVVGSAAMMGIRFSRIETVNPISGFNQLFYGNVKAKGSAINTIFEHCKFDKMKPEAEQRDGFTDTLYYKNT